MTDDTYPTPSDEEIPMPVDEQLVAALAACVDHARDLIESAKALRLAGKPNIAYHLGTLALEELGRRELLGVEAVARSAKAEPGWPRKAAVDHVRKLFWCFFGGNFLAEQVTGASLAGMENLARRIHETRLAGLYVDQSDEGLSIPKDAVTAEELNQLLAFAEARFAMAANQTVRETVRRSEMERQSWFLTVADDPEKRKYVFSGASMAKLAELKDAAAWTDWLREQFDRADAEARAAAATEIERNQKLPSTRTKDKWRLRIRIRCASHTIRQKTLNLWNEKSDWLKLTMAKKDELILEIVLGDEVPIAGLWFIGWGIARHFVLALNIGTMGFWWWQLPEQTSRYYEQLYDLEAKREFAVERSPILTVDWGGNRVLNETDLGRVAACMASLPGPGDQMDRPAYGHYIAGLTFLSLNDIHWQCEPQAFLAFTFAMTEMMIETGELADRDGVGEAFAAFFERTHGKTSDLDRMAGLVTVMAKRPPAPPAITLSDVALLKLLCDTYFLTAVLPDRQGKGTPHKALG